MAMINGYFRKCHAIRTAKRIGGFSVVKTSANFMLSINFPSTFTSTTDPRGSQG